MSAAPPRVRPGTRRQIGTAGALIAAALGRAAGTEHPPNLFTTVARHRRLFATWLPFAGSLMPGGTLPRGDTEIVILRVAHNCACAYEWHHHERLALSTDLTREDVERVRTGPDAEGWSDRRRMLLRTADELHAQRTISDALWAELAAEFPEAQLIELCMLVGHYEMLAMTINALGIAPDRRRHRRTARGPAHDGPSLAGRRVLITGAARGIGAATARRLHERGARLALAGLEPEQLARAAAEAGNALAITCDVRDRAQVEAAVEQAAAHLGGLDVVIANAGVAAQLPILGGDPEIFERTVAVNLLGVYYTLRAAAPHISHPSGYALAISSLAAAVHPPLLGAYSASKAGVEALAEAFRAEMAGSGARVGVAYFAELDTDMTRRGFGTEAARRLPVAGRHVTPLARGIDAIERGVARRSRRVLTPRWVGLVLPIRMTAQRVVEIVAQRGLADALAVAREERAPLTTDLPTD